MFVWDLPAIQEGTASLRTSRLRNFYAEVAPTCTVFGTLFGKALQAQVGIALRCTLLFRTVRPQHLCAAGLVPPSSANRVWCLHRGLDCVHQGPAV